MGAASSFPAQLSEEHARLVIGAEAWTTVEARWPVGRPFVTRDELEAMLKDHPEVSRLPVKWDEMPAVGGTTAAAAKREKVAQAKRDRLASEKRRREKLAVLKAKPPRAMESAEKRAQRQQSQQLRDLLRQQRQAAREEGRPSSRGGGLEDVTCELYIKPQDGGDFKPQIMTLGEKSEPEMMTFGDDDDSNADVVLDFSRTAPAALAPAAALAAEEALPTAAAPAAAPPDQEVLAIDEAAPPPPTKARPDSAMTATVETADDDEAHQKKSPRAPDADVCAKQHLVASSKEEEGRTTPHPAANQLAAA